MGFQPKLYGYDLISYNSTCSRKSLFIEWWIIELFSHFFYLSEKKTQYCMYCFKCFPLFSRRDLFLKKKKKRKNYKKNLTEKYSS